MRTILFTGKGGVGKTTLAAATSLKAAALGHRTLVISTDIAHSLSDSLAVPLASEPSAVGPPGLFAAELQAGEELERYWGDVKRKVAAALKDQGLGSAVAGEMAILPGLDEILSLVRIRRYLKEGEYDVLVIDSAPTGAAMRLLSAPFIHEWYMRNLMGLPAGIKRIVLSTFQALPKLPLSDAGLKDKVKKLFDEVDHLRRIFTDPEQTSVRLVLNPDRMSVAETERAFTFFSLYGLNVDALYVNRVLPPEIADPYLSRWKVAQAEWRKVVADNFAPLPVFEIPLMPEEVTGIDRLTQLGDALYKDTDPVRRLSDAEPMRFEMEDGRYCLSLRLVGVKSREVDLEKRGDELKVRIGHYRRTIALPAYAAGLKPAMARIEGGWLKVVFEE